MFTCASNSFVCGQRKGTTVDFDKLVRAASEIATAKDNCAEASNTSVCGVSGDKTMQNGLEIVI